MIFEYSRNSLSAIQSTSDELHIHLMVHKEVIFTANVVSMHHYMITVNLVIVIVMTLFAMYVIVN